MKMFAVYAKPVAAMKKGINIDTIRNTSYNRITNVENNFYTDIFKQT